METVKVKIEGIAPFLMTGFPVVAQDNEEGSDETTILG
jgi:hypothetical protein